MENYVHNFTLNFISSHSTKYQQQWHGRDKSDEVCEEEEQKVVSQAWDYDNQQLGKSTIENNDDNQQHWW